MLSFGHDMTAQDANQAPGPPTSPRFLPVLLVLFFASGCSALIYEIVWLQLLQLSIGSSAISLGVLLATLRGPGLRKWLFGAQIDRDRNLRLQYLAGVGMDSRGAIFIYDQILSYQRFPGELFQPSQVRSVARSRPGPPDVQSTLTRRRKEFRFHW